MTEDPTFRICTAVGVNSGAKIFVCGNEIPNVVKIEFSTSIDADNITQSKITLTVAEAVAVETVSDGGQS